MWINYNYHRDYDPAIGRYLQSDPIGLKGGLSTFGYANGMPLTLSDPLGLHAGTMSPGWSWGGLGDGVAGLCRGVGIGLTLMLYSGKGDSCSDDPRRERKECKPTDDEKCRDQWIADTAWCDNAFKGRKNVACHAWASEQFGRCKNNQNREPFRV